MLWYFALAVLFAALLFYPVTTTVMYHRAKRYHRAQGIDYPPMGLAHFVDFNRQLMVGVTLLFYWSLRYRHRDDQPVRPEHGANADAPLVLFVHGFHMNGSCFWGMRRFAEARGWASYAINLGLPYTDPNRYASRLIDTANNILAKHPGQKLHLVGHSMGGLIIRMALRAEPTLASRLASIVTLGTPHQGTAVVSPYALTWVKEMFHPDSDFIGQLPEFDTLCPGLRVTTIASEQDLVVYPAAFAHTQYGKCIDLFGISHMGLLTEEPIQALVLNQLQAATN